MTSDYEAIKWRLVDIFEQRVLGKRPDISDYNPEHDGREGHWLEKQFGKAPDADNEADFWGFELKNETTSGKTTFGDWSPNYCIYKDTDRFGEVFFYPSVLSNQNLFCHIFGKPNPLKNNRYSYSGLPVPKLDHINLYGQWMIIEYNNDISIYYSYHLDRRPDKNSIVPPLLQENELLLFRWFGESFPEGYVPKRLEKCLKDKLENKFNQNGWFKCTKDDTGCYDKICFGYPISFEKWIEFVKKGIVYFDSGMHEGNRRPYQSWRANNDFWEKLIYDRIDKLRIDMNRYCAEHNLACIAVDEYLRRTNNE